MKTIKVYISSAGSDITTFTLKDQTAQILATNVTKAELIAGYTITIPDSVTSVLIDANGACVGSYKVLDVSGAVIYNEYSFSGVQTDAVSACSSSTTQIVYATSINSGSKVYSDINHTLVLGSGWYGYNNAGTMMSVQIDSTGTITTANVC